MRLRVLIQQSTLPHYRIPLFNKLSESVDLSIVHGGQVLSDCNFDQISRKVFKLKGLCFQRFLDLVPRYDVVITEANLRYLFTNVILAFKPKKFRWIAWGIGLSASLENRLGEKKLFDILRFRIFNKSDAIIFYSKIPIRYYKNSGIPESKLYVANNTVDVLNVDFSLNRSSFVFIGSMYKEKGLGQLCRAYESYCNTVENPLMLEFIGEGEDKERTKGYLSMVTNAKFIFHGAVYDESKIATIMQKAYLSISPNQAGLSVLKSMGYGVPFVTSTTAITGGEISNISNGDNGFLFSTTKELSDLLVDCHNNPFKYVKVGMKAKDYYNNCATIESYSKSFMDAIKGV